MKQNDKEKLYENYKECVDILTKVNNQIKTLTLQEIENYKSVLIKSARALESQLKTLEEKMKFFVSDLQQKEKDNKNNQNQR